MRDLPVEIQAELAKRTGVNVKTFLYVRARNRTTGEPEMVGFWNGHDVATFVVDGQSRIYHGAGSLLGVETYRQASGLHIRSLNIRLSVITPELDAALRLYDSKNAPVEVHQGFFSTETNELVAPLQRVFKGWINKFPVKMPAKGGNGTATVQMVSQSRMLTKKSGMRRSHETQIKRNPVDAFFKFVAITGQLQVAWGAKTVYPTYSSGGGGGSIGGGSESNVLK